ncbi:hypothetical protein GXM_08760 [Nostoc sphaeroides CCNUC1]|uniref:Uncharacterized protein n=1 Tax=Nostoc sphaeroides CCNUC1 TaxID=2653204 RepID=A0A5P8WGF8_9NOSO|nr:hypothetical protein GXM_08760 [Nostoc sphaeroides CCNUC1]
MSCDSGKARTSRAIANVKNFATTRLLSAFAANDRQQIYC